MARYWVNHKNEKPEYDYSYLTLRDLWSDCFSSLNENNRVVYTANVLYNILMKQISTELYVYNWTY